MQETRVQSLVQEDSTHHQATKPVCPRAHALQIESSFYFLQLEKACAQQQRPSTAKNKKVVNLKKKKMVTDKQ